MHTSLENIFIIYEHCVIIGAPLPVVRAKRRRRQADEEEDAAEEDAAEEDAAEEERDEDEQPGPSDSPPTAPVEEHPPPTNYW